MDKHQRILAELEEEYTIYWYNNWKHLPKYKCGVYLLVKKGKVIYVGQSIRLRGRLQPSGHQAYDGSQQIGVIFIPKRPGNPRFQIEREIAHRFGLI